MSSPASIQNTFTYQELEKPLVEWQPLIYQDCQYELDLHSDTAHWPVLWWTSNKFIVLNPIINHSAW